MEVSDQLRAPAALLHGKKPPVPTIHRRMNKPQSWSGHGGEEKIFPSLPLPGIESRPSSPYTSHYTDRATQAPADNLSDV
jgi:hypothetical protein